MALRASSAFFAGTGILALTWLSLLAGGEYRRVAQQPAIERTAALVKRLELTDLCLFTEASYTRHLALADRHTPFQDDPLSMEHFPTGSLAGPPEHLRKYHGTISIH
jgi:hypothetical protein